MEYELAIIGGGPAGYNAAERATANGIKQSFLRKMPLEGCVLMKDAFPQKHYCIQLRFLIQ